MGSSLGCSGKALQGRGDARLVVHDRVQRLGDLRGAGMLQTLRPTAIPAAPPSMAFFTISRRAWSSPMAAPPSTITGT